MRILAYSDYLKHWLSGKEKLVKASSYANYSLKVENHLIPTLGKYNVREIDSVLVQKVIFSWLSTGSCVATGGLSLKSVKDLVTLIRSTLRDAAKEGYRDNLPIEVQYPRATEVFTKETMEASSQKRFVSYLEDNPCPHNLGLLIAMYTGMRIGEICALQWKNIDLKNHVIHVDKTLGRIFGRDSKGEPYSKVVISSPKTAHSHRALPIAKGLYDILSAHVVSDGSAYLLTGNLGYTEPSNYRQYYYKLLKKLNIPQLNFHGLRHTFASRLIEKGADYKTVSELLGHANVNMTLNIYVHSNIGQKRKAVEKLSF